MLAFSLPTTAERKNERPLTMTISPFLAALGSEAPPADRAKDMDLYGWLVGSWEMQTVRHLDDGTTEESTGEIHFGWVLEGRAIQDIWIRPRRPAPFTMVRHDFAYLRSWHQRLAYHLE